MFRIGLVQMRCEKADMTGNLAVMSRYISESRRLGVDLLAFPEMSFTGYADPTRYNEAQLRLDGPEVSQLMDATRGFPGTVLAGIIEYNPPGKPFITQLALSDGRLTAVYRKRTIVGDEAQLFSPGGQVEVVRDGKVTFGMAICADIENESVFRDCRTQGAEIIFECAAPGLYGDQADRNWRSGFEWWKGECEKRLGLYARKYNVWIAVTTQAGRTIDEDFPGGGYLFSPSGALRYQTADGSEGAVYLAVDTHSGAATLI